MPRIFKLQQVTFIGSDQTLINTNTRIEFNNDEAVCNIDIAVYVMNAKFFQTKGNGINLLLNNNATGTPLNGIITNSNDTAIYQVSIPLDAFNLRDNIINFRTTSTSFDDSGNPTGTTVSSAAFATATGFVHEATPLEVRMQRTSFDQTPDVAFCN